MPFAPPIHGQAERLARQREYDRERGTAAERGYDRRWQKYRAWYLSQHPLCVYCQAKGIVRAATVVDHIEPHKGDERKFWNEANHQSLCAGCHNRKTASEDMGSWRKP